MLNARAVEAVLQEATCEGVKTIMLVTHDGCIIANSVARKSNKNETCAAMLASTYTEYFALSDRLSQMLIDCEKVRIGVEMLLQHIIVVVIAKKGTPFGFIKYKLESLKISLADFEQTLMPA
eukprot:Platyproteum_vivax@DN3034_c0_g1_i1.p1